MPTIIRHHVKKGGALSILQVPSFDAPRGRAFADLEVRDGDQLVVTYGYDRGSWWGVEVRNREHGEAVIAWIVGPLNRCRVEKPQILADSRGDSPFKGLPVIDEHQDYAAPLNVIGSDRVPVREV